MPEDYRRKNIDSFIGGENTLTNDRTIADNEQVESVNFIDTKFNSLKKRGGKQKYLQQNTANDIINLFRYIRKDHIDEIIAVLKSTSNTNIGNIRDKQFNSLVIADQTVSKFGGASIFNELFIGNGSNIMKVINEEGVFDVGLQEPTIAPVVEIGTDQVLWNGEWVFVVTYMYGSNGRRGESNPSIYSQNIKNSNKSVKITIPTGGVQVSARRIYRARVVEGLVTDFFFIKQIDDNTTTLYNVIEEEQPGNEPASFINFRPNFYARYFIEYQGRMWYAYSSEYKTKVWRSNLLNPESFSPEEEYDVGASDGTPITGFAKINDRLLVYKEDDIYWWTGEDFQLIVSNVGCKAPNTLTQTGFGVFFVGRNDVYLYQGGSQCEPIGTKIFNQISKWEDFNNIEAEFYQDRYYICYFPITGYNFVYDTYTKNWRKWDNIEPSDMLVIKDNDLLISEESMIYTIDKGVFDETIKKIYREYDSSVLINNDYVGSQTKPYVIWNGEQFGNPGNNDALFQYFPVTEDDMLGEILGIKLNMAFNFDPGAGVSNPAPFTQFAFYLADSSNTTRITIPYNTHTGIKVPVFYVGGDPPALSVAQENNMISQLVESMDDMTLNYIDLRSYNIRFDMTGAWQWVMELPSGVDVNKVFTLNAAHFTGINNDPMAGTRESAFGGINQDEWDGANKGSVVFTLYYRKASPVVGKLTLKDDDLGIPENRKRYRNINVLGKLDDNLRVRYTIGRANGTPVAGSMLYGNVQSAVGIWNSSLWQTPNVVNPSSNIYAQPDRKISYRDAINFNLPPTCVGERIQIELEHNTIGDPEIQKLSYSYKVKKDH